MNDKAKILALLVDELAAVPLDKFNERIADFFGFSEELKNYVSGVNGYDFACADAERYEIKDESLGAFTITTYADTPEAKSALLMKESEKQFMNHARQVLELKISTVRENMEKEMGPDEVYIFCESRVGA